MQISNSLMARGRSRIHQRRLGCRGKNLLRDISSVFSLHSSALGTDAINSKALIFNVKGEDLLWLDTPNSRMDAEARAQYAKLGLPAGAFQSVRIYAPAKRKIATLMPDVGGRASGVFPCFWTLRQFAEPRLLRFAFVGADDHRAQLSFVVTRIEHKLAEAAQGGKANDPSLTIEGKQLTTFRELVEMLDDTLLESLGAPGCGRHARRIPPAPLQRSRTYWPLDKRR